MGKAGSGEMPPFANLKARVTLNKRVTLCRWT